ncbi:MAG: T9SS type A sorting domain-containing protein, partial [Calditrichia bacterium]
VEVKKDKYAPRDTLLQVWPDSLLSISLQLLDSTSGIGSAGPQYANAFALEQNYPNPFNAQTIIKYYLPVSDFVEVAIYDITGRKMETLESGYIRSGEHRVAWNAADYASGIYVYKLITSEGTVSRKCMLIK